MFFGAGGVQISFWRNATHEGRQSLRAGAAMHCHCSTSCFFLSLSASHLVVFRWRQRRQELFCGPMTQRSCDGLVQPHPSLPPFYSAGPRSGCRWAAGSLAAHITAREGKKRFFCLCQFSPWATEDNFNYLGKLSKVYLCVLNENIVLNLRQPMWILLCLSFLLTFSFLYLSPSSRGFNFWSC